MPDFKFVFVLLNCASQLDVDAGDEDFEVELATAVSAAVAASGIPLHKPGRRSNNSSDKEFFFDLGPGVFWCDNCTSDPRRIFHRLRVVPL